MKNAYTAEELEQLDPPKADPRKYMQFEVSKDPVVGRRVKITVHDYIGFSDTEKKRHQSACVPAEVVVNSLELKKKILAYNFKYTDLTPEQIYNKFIAGAETLNKETDYEIDVQVKIYYENNSTVGYTYGSTPQTWVNRKFFGQYTLGEIAGNLIHEYCHKLGFEHPSNATTDRPHSVPYAIGYLVRDMVAAYERGAVYTDLYPLVVSVPSPTAPEIKVPVIVPVVEKKRVCRRVWWTLWLKQVCLYE